VDPARWARVKAIVADAMERDDDARASFVDEACGGDAALRREVARLLAADRGADSLLDAPALAGVSAQEEEAREEGRLLTTTSSIREARRRGTTQPRESQWPPEMVQRSAGRLGTLALLYAIGFLLAYLIYEFTVHGLRQAAYEQPPHTPGQIVMASFVTMALGVYALARRRIHSATRLVRIGLAFEVAGSLGIGLVSYSGPWPADQPVWGVSWICVWIMMFPLVIPGPPRAAAIAAFASAAMGPAAIVAWSAFRAAPLPSAGTFIATTAPNFICATLAWIGARYVYRIGLDLREARRLGSYRLVRRIGRGGMGEVWVAEHDMLARPAALKLVRPDLMEFAASSASAARRFEREAQSTAQLTSPHTVNLYDFGVTEDGVFYYVMELLEGFDLDTLVRRFGPVSAGRAIHFMRQICDSLAEAHARDFVHRDIKPSNVFASRQGMTFDFVKVLDFGIVRRRTDPGASAPSGGIEGSPAFMAPEAASAGVASPRTDLYALGCVGYWLLTGETVFPANTPVEAVAMHLSQPPQPPSQRSRHVVPAALDALILECLQKDPEQRPPSASHLAGRLAAIETVLWSVEDAERWWRAHAPAAGEWIPGVGRSPGPSP
jgi:eukaryotic-like serine/threonine-protein kinase